jgi:DNA topoisomerase IB
LRALLDFEAFNSQAQAKRNVNQAIEAVAKRLGNTKTVCRNCYVHPAIIETYFEEQLVETLSKLQKRVTKRPQRYLKADELALLNFLSFCSKAAVKSRRPKRASQDLSRQLKRSVRSLKEARLAK